MPYVAFRRSTGEVIPDFQSLATPRGLEDNAVRRGIPREDIEVREVQFWEYERLEEAVFGPIRQARATQAQAAQERGRDVLARLGLTEDEARDLTTYLETLR